MPDRVRNFISRLREYIGDRRRAPRRDVRLPFRIWLLNKQLTLEGPRRAPKIDGHTRDVSRTGLALIVPTLRIGETFLTEGNQKLHIALELPPGPVQLNAVPIRFEDLGEDSPDKGFVIGVSIAEMNMQDRSRYNAYVDSIT